MPDAIVTSSGTATVVVQGGDVLEAIAARAEAAAEDALEAAAALADLPTNDMPMQRITRPDDPVFANGTVTNPNSISSTFSGWAMPFDWDGTEFDMAEAYVRVEHKGAILRAAVWEADGTLLSEGYTRANKASGWFTFFLTQRIDGAARILYVSVQSAAGDSRMQRGAVTGHDDVAAPATYPQRYITTAAPDPRIAVDDWTSIGGTGAGSPFGLRLYDSRDTRDQGERLTAPRPTQILMTPRFFAMVGKETSLYFADLQAGQRPRAWDVFGTTGTGIQQAERFKSAPAANFAAQSIELWSMDADEIEDKETATFTLDAVLANAAAAATRKILLIGDSITNPDIAAGASYRERFLANAVANASGVQPTMIGTLGTGADKHEGRPGWSLANYYSTYDDGTAQPDSINPFISADGQKFNFAFYLSDNALDTPDIVVIHLGINDMATLNVIQNQTDAALQAAIDTYLTQLDKIIGLTADAAVGSLKEASAGVKTILCVPISPAPSQDPFGAQYGLQLSRARYRRNIGALQHRMIEHYADAEADNVFLVPWHAAIDPATGWQTETVAANANTATTVTRITDAVHPAQTGHHQLGDMLWAAVNVLVVRGLA